MRLPSVAATLAAALAACSSTKSSDATGGTAAGLPVQVTVASISSAVTVSEVQRPVIVSAVQGPVAVAGVADPVVVSGVATPVSVSEVQAPVTISSVRDPVSISSIASPVVVTGAVAIPRPENDPERIETGDLSSANSIACNGAEGIFCQALVAGPFVLTDLVATSSLSGSNPRMNLLVCPTADGPCFRPRWRIVLAMPSRSWDTIGSVGLNSLRTTTETSVGGVVSVAGGRFGVRAGETLYAASYAVFDLTWSGFRP